LQRKGFTFTLRKERKKVRKKERTKERKKERKKERRKKEERKHQFREYYYKTESKYKKRGKNLKYFLNHNNLSKHWPELIVDSIGLKFKYLT
jgi:hypothetical protein